jgi:hypothetical protein
MPTKLQPRPFLATNTARLSETHRETTGVKAAQRDFYVLVAVFLGSLTLMGLAVALSGAIMLANAAI